MHGSFVLVAPTHEWTNRQGPRTNEQPRGMHPRRARPHGCAPRARNFFLWWCRHKVAKQVVEHRFSLPKLCNPLSTKRACYLGFFIYILNWRLDSAYQYVGDGSLRPQGKYDLDEICPQDKSCFASCFIFIIIIIIGLCCVFHSLVTCKLSNTEIIDVFS